MNRFTRFKNGFRTRFSTMKLLQKANLSRRVANHLVGEDHTPQHRKVIGVGIMVFGVVVAKSTSHIDFFIIHILGDGLGYFFHAVGAIPFIKTFETVGGQLLDTTKNSIEDANTTAIIATEDATTVITTDKGNDNS